MNNWRIVVTATLWAAVVAASIGATADPDQTDKPAANMSSFA
jgi:hypothetical protein